MSNIGEIIMWAGTLDNMPAGYLHCDGSALLIKAYEDLYNVIATNFGANPPDKNFYLPDLRGRFIRGVDDGSNRDPDNALRTDMRDTSLMSSGIGSIQSSAVQDHTHSYIHFPDGGSGIAGGTYWGCAQDNTGGINTQNSENQSVTTSNYETRPLNAYLYFLIRYSA